MDADTLTDDQRRDISDLAVLAESTYNRTQRGRINTISQHVHDIDRYEYIGDYQSRNHSLIYDNQKDRYIFTIAGTDIEGSVNKKQRNEDLFTDAVLAAAGGDYMKFLPRYKQSVRELNKVKGIIGPEAEVIISAHSLGGAIGRQLTMEYGIESHSFASGSSPISTFLNVAKGTLRKDVRDRLAKNHTYLVFEPSKEGVDPLSVSDSLNPYTNNYIYKLKRDRKGGLHKNVKKSVFPAHSSHNFITDRIAGSPSMRPSAVI
jgi:hypothetical protein